MSNCQVYPLTQSINIQVQEINNSIKVSEKQTRLSSCVIFQSALEKNLFISTSQFQNVFEPFYDIVPFNWRSYPTKTFQRQKVTDQNNP